ncbi:MAG TPA: hypothetical protein VFG63_07995 [Nocardioidaceae bacterium]|nr:hypothetical protein [Nocardioidaceae bacterium]
MPVLVLVLRLAFTVQLPKYGSERVLHLPDDLVEMLRSHVERYLPDDSRRTGRALGHSSATTTLNTYSHLWLQIS